MSHPERIVADETSPGILAIHLKRYEFARPWCEGREVLDAGCGVGYGSAYLAGFARRVTAVDIDAETIGYARRRYGRDNLSFVCGDLLDLDLADGSVDVACAFESIEHLPDRERFLAEMTRVLRPDGVLVVSTPRVDATTEVPANPHHRVEYSLADFRSLLAGAFGRVEVYGERRLQTGRHRAMQRVDVLGLRRRLAFLRPVAHRLLGTRPMAELTADDLVIDREDVERATELVAVCSEPRQRNPCA
jgi:SAM-dependent methyltransferase